MVSFVSFEAVTVDEHIESVEITLAYQNAIQGTETVLERVAYCVALDDTSS